MSDPPADDGRDEAEADEDNPEFDRFEALTKKLLGVEDEPENESAPGDDAGGSS
jgi:hypothetical protein